MRKILTVVASSVLLLAPLAAPASAAGKGLCSTDKMPSFKKVIDVRPGGVGKATKKRPYGSVTGRYAKLKKNEFNDGYYAPYGGKHTVAFAKKATICVLYSPKTGGVAMRKVGLPGLRKAVDKPKMNPQWGLRFNAKGRVTLAYQIYAP
ncbi:hypothetical protein [Actinocorallia sp. A-T 12471]|uniref:hypothetical protein n=1 Tax=Actinocorallia sp. A-T 12471 TaxID=3089813 RepID=UPI0029D1F480|nr:hypothetical protein [Actinocorallia sp. A-T 12471]MDX6743333.1 hypothetical protein [Actinocorallia sp. A-T 12471]